MGVYDYTATRDDVLSFSKGVVINMIVYSFLQEVYSGGARMKIIRVYQTPHFFKKLSELLVSTNAILHKCYYTCKISNKLEVGLGCHRAFIN